MVIKKRKGFGMGWFGQSRRHSLARLGQLSAKEKKRRMTLHPETTEEDISEFEKDQKEVSPYIPPKPISPHIPLGPRVGKALQFAEVVKGELKPFDFRSQRITSVKYDFAVNQRITLETVLWHIFRQTDNYTVKFRWDKKIIERKLIDLLEGISSIAYTEEIKKIVTLTELSEDRPSTEELEDAKAALLTGITESIFKENKVPVPFGRWISKLSWPVLTSEMDIINFGLLVLGTPGYDKIVRDPFIKANHEEYEKRKRWAWTSAYGTTWTKVPGSNIYQVDPLSLPKTRSRRQDDLFRAELITIVEKLVLTYFKKYCTLVIFMIVQKQDQIDGELTASIDLELGNRKKALEKVIPEKEVEPLKPILEVKISEEEKRTEEEKRKEILDLLDDIRSKGGKTDRSLEEIEGMIFQAHTLQIKKIKEEGIIKKEEKPNIISWVEWYEKKYRDIADPELKEEYERVRDARIKYREEPLSFIEQIGVLAEDRPKAERFKLRIRPESNVARLFPTKAQQKHLTEVDKLLINLLEPRTLGLYEKKDIDAKRKFEEIELL